MQHLPPCLRSNSTQSTTECDAWPTSTRRVGSLLQLAKHINTRFCLLTTSLITAGVGKTAIAEGLAQRIVRGDVPSVLKDTRVIALDMGTLVAGVQGSSLLWSTGLHAVGLAQAA